MGQIRDGNTPVTSDTQQAIDQVRTTLGVDTISRVASETTGVVSDAIAAAGRAVLLTLSTAWIGIGLINPARTNKQDLLAQTVANDTALKTKQLTQSSDLNSYTQLLDRYDTSKMWGVKFGDYFMPLSQTYSLSASKKLNISSLVDGIDIIQQTRKEAKTIECTLKISINENQDTLQIMKGEEGATSQLSHLHVMLADLYEQDTVFKIDNETIKKTFGVEYAIMTRYKFLPRAGSNIYIFEFSLMEVKFGDNVLTFDESQIQESTV